MLGHFGRRDDWLTRGDTEKSNDGDGSALIRNLKRWRAHIVRAGIGSATVRGNSADPCVICDPGSRIVAIVEVPSILSRFRRGITYNFAVYCLCDRTIVVVSAD